ncbi:MAG: efflux RND transporter periplasmic adaptor subunit [Pseudomonadota bacterium]|nr:efflux RND transporter periplasmic adaptor subunit [Pseudomonadota bacterium]
MKHQTRLISLVLAGLFAAGGYGLYVFGMQRGMAMGGASTPSATTSGSETMRPATGGPPSAAEGEEATRRHMQAGLKAGDVDPVNGKKILYYHDPMAPGKRFDKPGKSPFMDMMLSPVYAGSDSDQGNVTVSSRMQQSLGVRTARVTEGTLSPQVSVVGGIAFDERDQAVVQARATGYVEKLYVRATLDHVAKGQPLVDLYVPDWVAAQEEFLSVRGMQGTDLAVLVDGARQRMRQVGMTEDQIRLVERTGKTQPRISLVAPISGIVVELMVREGMTVMSGATLFRINGLSTVWANAEVPESQSALVRPGAKVRATSAAAPGTTINGTVQAILPAVDAATRTLKARVQLANPGGRLVPGMFVQMRFADLQQDKGLLVPTEAVIQTGKRTLVMLAEDKGRFRPVEVEIGVESGGQTEIKRGLKLGDEVVVSSQFLIDSEASLSGIEARLNAQPSGPAASTAMAAASVAKNVGEATVEKVGDDALTLSHGPIPTLKWPPMTMDFKLPPGGAPRRVKAGDRVAFEFVVGADGVPQLTSVTPLAAAPKAAIGPDAGRNKP